MSLPLVLPTLQNDLVQLRSFAEPDVDMLIATATDPYIPLVTSVPTAGTADAAREYIQRQHSRLLDRHGFSFAIAERATGHAVGQIGLWLQEASQGRGNVGYWLTAAARGRGYATSALELLSSWGLHGSELHRLQLRVEPWNEGSWRAAERAGYLREGLLRSWEPIAGTRRDMYMYSRLRDS